MLLGTVVLASFTAAFAYVLITIIHNRYFHPLKQFPGPFLASITSLWYFRTTRYGVADNNQRPLHDKYGPFVRITPDTLAISEPSALDIIYGPPRNGQHFLKGEFYKGFRANIPGAGNDSFSEQDVNVHGARRRIQAPLYTQGSVLGYEPCVDRVIKLFCDRIDSFGGVWSSI
jgi:hypothetical protein